MLKQADLVATQIAVMKRLYALQQQITAVTHFIQPHVYRYPAGKSRGCPRRSKGSHLLTLMPPPPGKHFRPGRPVPPGLRPGRWLCLATPRGIGRGHHQGGRGQPLRRRQRRSQGQDADAPAWRHHRDGRPIFALSPLGRRHVGGFHPARFHGLRPHGGPWQLRGGGGCDPLRARSWLPSRAHQAAKAERTLIRGVADAAVASSGV